MKAREAENTADSRSKNAGQPGGTESVQSCIVLACAWRIQCRKTREKYSSGEIRHDVPCTRHGAPSTRSSCSWAYQCIRSAGSYLASPSSNVSSGISTPYSRTRSVTEGFGILRVWVFRVFGICRISRHSWGDREGPSCISRVDEEEKFLPPPPFSVSLSIFPSIRPNSCWGEGGGGAKGGGAHARRGTASCPRAARPRHTRPCPR